MVSEIQNETGKISCHSGSLFALSTSPSPPNDPENQTFEKKKKMKKIHADIILLYIHVHHK